jgi:hypothetical protein
MPNIRTKQELRIAAIRKICRHDSSVRDPEAAVDVWQLRRMANDLSTFL